VKLPYYNIDGTSTCPLGFPMSQNRMAVPTWSHAFEIYPPARVLELGTAGGGFITALAVHAWNLEPRAAVHTWDLSQPNEKIAPLAAFLGVQFHVADIWESEAEIRQLIASPGVTYLLCDGGDKARELATFASSCKPGDVLAAHDYDAVHDRDPSVPLSERPWQWSEIRMAHGDTVATANDLEPWRQDAFDAAGWLVFKRRAASCV
jgi:hypothetical protein